MIYRQSPTRVNECQSTGRVCSQSEYTYDLLYISELLVASNCNGLDQELVAASRVERWLDLHCLQEYYQEC